MAGVLGWGAVVMGVASMGAGRPVEPTAALRRYVVTVVVGNQIGVPQRDLDRALVVAAQIFGSAAIDLHWISPDEFARRAPREDLAFRAYAASVVHVRLVQAPAAPAEVRALVLGSVPAGTSLAYVFADRVDEQLRQQRTPADLLLGYVIAHEVGHVLLGPNAHARAGIMQARVHHAAIRSREQSFDPVQAQAMQQAAARRHALGARVAAPVILASNTEPDVLRDDR